MNYTANYHLPQWDETDRIMRTDFNRMCADMEAGMTLNAQAAQTACQISDDLDQKTLKRLRRLAYNHYSTVQDMDPFPWQAGVFHQNPAKDKSGVTNASLLNGVYYAGKNPAGTMLGSIGSYMQQSARMTLVKNDLAACTALQADICVPVNAYVNRIGLSGNIRGNVPNTPFPVRLTLTNLDTGEVEASRLLDIAQSIGDGSTSNDFRDCFLAFYAGQHYRLQMEPLAAVFTGDMSIQATGNQAVVLPANSTAPISAVHTMREHEESSGGLLIVRGLIHSGTLTVSWDGRPVPLHATRMVQISDGRMVREMAYYRNETIPAETEFSLQFNPGEHGSFLFYDWGAVLL
ncbi:MAG: hypothetical protein K2O45_07010 [Oscillospiraceae bacterium]|nr:hypothetical protein [Oscillospiraceae bacterium]